MINFMKLGDVVSFENGDRGANYPNNSDFVKSGIPFIRGGDIENGRIVYKNLDFITDEKYDQLRAGKANKNDILFSLRGSLGKCVRNPFDKAAIASALVIIRPNTSVINSTYLFHVINSPFFTKQGENNDNGSVQINLSVEILKEFTIPVPSLAEQEKIANSLTVIEDKIENNTRINSTLESLAKTIYDYWFLQYEFPNEDGNPYKSSGGKMVYNEELKREIPEGWKVKRVRDCIQHINTGLNPRDNFVLNEGGNIKYVTVKNLTTNGSLDFTGCDTITNEVKTLINRRSLIDKGDILFASIAPLGRCYLIQETPKDWEINESVFSIRPDYDVIPSEYLYMYLMSDWFVKSAEHSSTGSIFSGVRVSVLEDMKILVPSAKILNEFSSRISTIFNQKNSNNNESQRLTALRDFLLPILMNGQAKVE